MTRFRGAFSVAVAVALVVAGCGGDDDDTSAPASETTTADSAGDETTTSEPDVDGEITSTTEADDPRSAAAAVVVDPTALSTDATDYETLTSDLCAAHSVEELDAFFNGAGDLAIEETLPRGCRWAVEGLPRSHSVTLTLQPDSAPDIFTTREETIAGTTVLLNSSRSEGRAWIPAPDGSDNLLEITVSGSFDSPGGPLPDGYLDPAVFALVENLLTRLG